MTEHKRIRGYTALCRLSEVDDGLIEESLALFERGSGGVTPALHRGRRTSRVLDSGWFAASVSLLVAFGVLIGIVAAGRQTPTADPHGASTAERTQPEANETTSPSEQETYVLPNAPVTVTVGAYTIYLTQGYPLFESDGATPLPSATEQLPDFVETGETSVISRDGHVSVELRDEGAALTRVVAYGTDEHKVAEGDSTDLLTDLPDGSYYIILTVFKRQTNGDPAATDGGSYTEYAFMIVKDSGYALY